MIKKIKNWARNYCEFVIVNLGIERNRENGVERASEDSEFDFDKEWRGDEEKKSEKVKGEKK